MMTPLRQKMLNDMKLRRFAPRIQYAYINAVTGLADAFKARRQIDAALAALKKVMKIQEK